MQGIGIDIIELNRMRETIERSGEVFLKRVFTALEIKRGRSQENPTRFFASAFAAKEAVFKALVLDWDRGVDFREIEIYRGVYGEPMTMLRGAVKKQAEAKGCSRILISLSYETDLAVALALVC